jgi:type IV secretory pathway component VirB8
MGGPLFDGGIWYCVLDLFLASLERSMRMLFIAAVLFVVLNACIIIVHIFSVFLLQRQLHLL